MTFAKKIPPICSRSEFAFANIYKTMLDICKLPALTQKLFVLQFHSYIYWNPQCRSKNRSRSRIHFSLHQLTVLCDLKIKPTNCDSHTSTHTATHTLYTHTGEIQANGGMQEKQKARWYIGKVLRWLTTTAKVIKCNNNGGKITQKKQEKKYKNK